MIREFEDKSFLDFFYFSPYHEFKINSSGLYIFGYILCKSCPHLKNNKVHQ